MQDFLSCCRQPSGVKTTIMILDVQLAVSHCGSPRDLALALQEERVASLPAALTFAAAPPPDSKVGGAVMDNGGGQLDVTKYVTFKDNVSTREASKLIAGSAYVPVSCPGPWAVKKAFQSLLDRLPGHHAHWSTVTKWEAPAKNGSSSASTWTPRQQPPPGSSMITHQKRTQTMSKYTWILLNIKKILTAPLQDGRRESADHGARQIQSFQWRYTAERISFDYFFTEALLG